MEENVFSQQSPQPGVSVVENTPPQPIRSSGKNNAKWIPVVILLLIAIGIVGWFILKGGSEVAPTPAPTPFVEETLPMQTTEPDPSSSPLPSVDKENIKVEILNGTGIAGEAALLQGIFKNLDYTTISVGNSDKQDVTTTQVTFSANLGEDITAELIAKLKETYKAVDVKTSSSSKNSIQVITGLRKGQTLPAATTAASASPSPTSSATPASTSSPVPTSSSQ